MIQIREYQQESIKLLRESFAKHQRVILCLPTGAGKTVVFSEMIRLAMNKGTKTLVLTDRIELATQTLKAIMRTTHSPQILNANTSIFSPEAPLSLAMVETLARRMKKWTPEFYEPQLLIIDEAHKNTFSKIINAFPNAKTIGATATPDAKFLHKYYTHIVDNIDIPELVQLGYLMPCRAFQMQDDFSDVEVSGGEFEEASLFNHFNKNKLYDGVIETYMEKTPGKKCLVFNCNMEHSDKMSKAFNDAGIHSESVTSKTPPEERRRILDAYSRGLFPVLNNCGILVAGYDDPTIEVIAMNRATMSLSLWLQCCGRGSRPILGEDGKADLSKKSHFTVLDFGKNHDRHGLWNQEREWSLDPLKKKKKKGVAPMKTCPNCSAMLPAKTKECEFCHHKFEEKGRELAEGVLVEVTENQKNDFAGRYISSLSVQELVALSKMGSVKKQQIWKVVRSLGIEAVREYGAGMGYKEFWLTSQLMEMNDYQYRDRLL